MITLSTIDASAGPAASSRLIKFERGASIYFQGDPVGNWFEVVGGVVRTVRLHADGGRQLTNFFYEGDYFGIESGRYSEAAEAVTDVTIRKYDSLPDRGQEPGFASGSSGIAVLEALRRAQECIFLLGRKTAMQRVAAFLIYIRGRSAGDAFIQIPMSRNDIADHLNLTIHTVSRTMTALVRLRLISLDGPQKFKILDAEGLRGLAQDCQEDEDSMDCNRSDLFAYG